MRFIGIALFRKMLTGILTIESRQKCQCLAMPLNFILFSAYPESYEYIKQCWEKTGKGAGRNNEYFIPLLRMGDPDAWKLFDNKIEQFVNTNGESTDMGEIDYILRQLRDSYSTAKILELLKVDKNYIRMSDGDPGEPFNCILLNFLVNDIFRDAINIGSSVKRSSGYDELMKHIPEIKVAAKKLIAKYKADEYYWMKNMPFYKAEH